MGNFWCDWRTRAAIIQEASKNEEWYFAQLRRLRRLDREALQDQADLKRKDQRYGRRSSL
jgi:hypothetical protein